MTCQYCGQPLRTGKKYCSKACQGRSQTARAGGVKQVPEGHSWCSAGKHFAPVGEFFISRARTTGLSGDCKACEKLEYIRSDRKLEQAREYYRNNAKKILERKKLARMRKVA